LFTFTRNIENQLLQTQIPTGEKELEALNSNPLSKDDNFLLSSLFD
jgi:hypothetical protein